MRLRIIEQNEAVRFDTFIAGAKYGDILQTYAWGHIKQPDWEPLRAVVEDDTGTILAAFSILFRRLPVAGYSVAYAPRGPVVNDAGNHHLWNFTLHAMSDLARQKKAVVLKVDPAIPENQDVAEALRNAGFHLTGAKHEFGGLQPRYTFRLPLNGSIEDIFSRFPKKLRYKINYGPKNGLNFRANEETSIADFYAALAETGERNDFLTRSPGYFQHLYDTLQKEDRILLLTGYVADEPVISSLTFCLGDKAWAVYGGQTDKHRKLYTYHAMNWERIKWAYAKGAVWFDFYGVPGVVDEEHPLYGLYHFKKSFGGDYVSLAGEWDKPFSGALYWLWETGLPRYRKFVRQTLRFRK
ncbi:MAG: peptidoglycan bridge formation glycyltransferase FemA/FemB family protein [Bacillota bacterium]|nr:peptidoglycan bridge formation glycyltransferase FemA/FemB family protein [Bacillota bacterium]MDW7683893.1 peptidoglycan bridge formation glycyltransferase FemA/FemB family protein [Bacillota bacterium]